MITFFDKIVQNNCLPIIYTYVYIHCMLVKLNRPFIFLFKFFFLLKKGNSHTVILIQKQIKQKPLMD